MAWHRYYQMDTRSKWVRGEANKMIAGSKYYTVLAVKELNDKRIYKGPLYLDLDKKPLPKETPEQTAKRIAEVQLEAQKVLNVLENNYELEIKAVHCWFTGSAGFHIMIPAGMFNGEPHPHLPLIYRKMVNDEFPADVFPLIDRTVYSEGKGRMWRVQNIRRSNGHYKIPVYPEEIMQKDEQFFIEASRKRRKIERVLEYQPNEPLSAVFQNVKMLVESEYFLNMQTEHVTVELPDKFIAPCIKRILNARRNVGKNFNEVCLILATFFVNAGFSLEEARIKLAGFFEFYNSKSYPKPHLREREFQKKYKYIQKYRIVWSCGYARFLNMCEKCPVTIGFEDEEAHSKGKEKTGGKEDEDFPMPSVYLNPRDNVFHLENLPPTVLYKKVKDLKKYGKIEKINYEDLMKVVNKWYVNYDPHLVKLILATIIANKFDGSPIWLLIRGAPSSGKTEFISALNALPFTVDASDLTPKALFSSDIILESKKKKKTTAWIAELNEKVLLFRDFTNTVNSKNVNDRKEILSQLRGIYDGKFTRTVGRKGITISWEGKIGMIGAATILYDDLTIIEGEQFGERLIAYKLRTSDDYDIDFIDRKIGQEEEKKLDVQRAFLSFFHDIEVPHIDDIVIRKSYKEKISKLQNLMARGRAPVKRARNLLIINVPEIERAPRIEKQLIMLAKALAVVEDRREVNDDDFEIISRIALSNIPNMRWSIIRFLYQQERIGIDHKDFKLKYISSGLNYSPSTVYYHLEELCISPIELVQKIALDSYNEEDDIQKLKWRNAANCYRLTYDCKKALDLINPALIDEY